MKEFVDKRFLAKRAVQLALLPALLFWQTACTSSTTVLLTQSMPQRPTKLQDIMVYLAGPPIKSRPLAMIAIARRGENSVWAIEALKQEAADMGADAITNLDVSYSSGFIPELRVSGLAVKYVVK